MSNPDSRLFRSGIDLIGSEPVLPPISNRPPALTALLAHLPGLAFAVLLMVSGARIELAWLTLIVSCSAALLAWHWRLPVWWRYINLGFLPLVGLALYLQTQLSGIDPNWFFAAFLLLALTSIGAVFTRVPLYLSSPRAAAELARRLPKKGRLIDLGCGLGGPLAQISKHRPDARLSGIEAAPLNWLIAKLRLQIIGAQADIQLGNLWDANLAEYDIVYAYLSPAPMARLWDKALLEMKPGSLFISNTFAISDADAGFDADEIVEISKPGDLSHARLLIWRM
jgi:hypothetical protein